MTRHPRVRALVGPVAVLLIAAGACADDTTGDTTGDEGSGAASTTLDEAGPTDRGDGTIRQHEYREGETFEYLYESTEASYATEPVRDGTVPRVTDLQRVDEVRTGVRVTLVTEDGELMKRVELIDPEYRELTSDDVGPDAAPVAFAPLRDAIPELPDEIVHTYPVGGDAEVAMALDEVFDGVLHPLVITTVDIFTWPAIIEDLPDGLAVGDTALQPAADVTLFGGEFHNHERLVIVDRVEVRDGEDNAYVKVQSPGNYSESFGIESNYQLAFHVPLEGDATGLVARGELQELVVTPAQGDAPATARQRQVSMTLRTSVAGSD